MADRLERNELQIDRLENTVNALARETGISIGGPCGECNLGHLLIKQEIMYCPKCGYEQYL